MSCWSKLIFRPFPMSCILCQGRMAGWWGGAHQMRMVVLCPKPEKQPSWLLVFHRAILVVLKVKGTLNILESQFGNAEFKDILRSWFYMECLFPVEICNFQWNGDVIFISDSSSSIQWIQCFILTLCWDSYNIVQHKHSIYIYNVTIDIHCYDVQSAQPYDVTPCKELTSGARSGGRLQGLVTELV